MKGACQLGGIFLILRIFSLTPSLAILQSTTRLMEAARKGEDATVSRLLGAGAKIDASDSEGYTALTIAAMSGHASTAKILLSRGSDPNHKTTFGYTPLRFAAALGNDDLVQSLLGKGADVNDFAHDGTTALMLAARNANVSTVQLLLRKGAIANKTDRIGRTALTFAYAASESKPGYRQTITILERLREPTRVPPQLTARQYLAAVSSANNRMKARVDALMSLVKNNEDYLFTKHKDEETDMGLLDKEAKAYNSLKDAVNYAKSIRAPGALQEMHRKYVRSLGPYRSFAEHMKEVFIEDSVLRRKMALRKCMSDAEGFPQAFQIAVEIAEQNNRSKRSKANRGN